MFERCKDTKIPAKYQTLWGFSDDLPQVVLDVVVELELLLPAVGAGGLADEGFGGGVDGTLAAVVLVIALAAQGGDEAVLDAALDAARHVVIDRGEAEGHAQRLGVAEEGAATCRHVGVAGIHGPDAEGRLGGVGRREPAKAMLATAAAIVQAEDVARRLGCKQLGELVLGLLLIGRTHICLNRMNFLNFGAKLRK